ncbi:LCP family protein [Streptomyces sp. A30]|uniref:LCP family protein n=1 Tax=Streptomyces sp. A30 TaxID=2789273 RepID=UPI00398149FB
MAALLGLMALGAGTVWWSMNHYVDNVQRIPDAFPHVREKERPVKPESAEGALNFVLAGVDSRSDLPTTGNGRETDLWRPGAQRTDSLMLLHLTADRRKAFVVAIPRDSWVPIRGHGWAKINAAYSWGGPPLLIDTVEKLTGIRIDHFGVIDWHGFRSLTDAVGGVNITIDSDDSYDSSAKRHWKPGTYTMNGEQALAYVRQRHGLPRGDLDRIERQQQFLRSLLGKVRGEIDVTQPLRLNKVLNSVTSTVSVDDRLSNSDLRDLALQLRNLRRESFVTAPVARFDHIDGQSVVILDAAKSQALWHAIAIDRVS